MMNKSKLALLLFVLLLGGLLAVAQPTFAQQDPSSDRLLGIGFFLPTAWGIGLLPNLDARLWLGDSLGLEGMVFISFTSPATGIGGGMLLKVINGNLLDIYAGARAIVSTAQFSFISVSVTSVSGTMGVELSPIRQLALSLEAGAGVIAASSFPIPEEFPKVFPVYGMSIHYYF